MNALSKSSDTNVAKKPVAGKILLQDNDLIEIGQRQFIFHRHFDAPGLAKGQSKDEDARGKTPLHRLTPTSVDMLVEDDAFEAQVHALREGTIGHGHCVVSPAAAAVFPHARDRAKAQRRIVYTDFTATGRALECIEGYIAEKVLPLHGNPHTLTTATARQSTHFREEARSVISNYFNCSHEDAVIFAGSGATGAIDKMVGLLVKSGGFTGGTVSGGQTGATDEQTQRFFSTDRWGGCECTLCGVRVKSESAFRAHVQSRSHQQRLAAQPSGLPNAAAAPDTSGTRRGRRRVVVMVDPAAHHSALLPFRELAQHYPIKKGGKPVFPSRSTHRVLQDAPALEAREAWELLEVETLELMTAGRRPGCTHCCLADLEECLSGAREFAARSATVDAVLPLVVLAGTSNVSGCAPDTRLVNQLVHRFGGLICWDLAAMASHRRFDFSGRTTGLDLNVWASETAALGAHPPGAGADFAFVSPHKLLGGPGCPGILLAKKRLLSNRVPVVPGGGAVFYVSSETHSYLQHAEHREEAGTPDTVGCVRAGLVYHVHSLLAQPQLEAVEDRLALRLLRTLHAQPKIHLLSPGLTALDPCARVESGDGGGGAGGHGTCGGGTLGRLCRLWSCMATHARRVGRACTCTTTLSRVC